MPQGEGGLNHSLLDLQADVFQLFVLAIGLPFALQAHAEDFAETLPEGGTRATQKLAYNLVRLLVTFAVDEPHQQFPLPEVQFLQLRLVFHPEVFLQLLEIFRLLPLRHVLAGVVGRNEQTTRVLCDWQRLFHIIDHAPIFSLVFCAGKPLAVEAVQVLQDDEGDCVTRQRVHVSGQDLNTVGIDIMDALRRQRRDDNRKGNNNQYQPFHAAKIRKNDRI